MNQTTHPGLIRGIRRWDLVAVAINGIIGAGIFGLPSKVFALIGPYSLIAFIVCALVVTLIVLCFAEVSSRFSETGGPYLYAREAFGSVVGFEVGWLVWLARLTAFAANCNLLIQYLGYFWPGIIAGWPRATVIIAIVVALTVVNVIGVRDAALFSDVFSIGKLIPIYCSSSRVCSFSIRRTSRWPRNRRSLISRRRSCCWSTPSRGLRWR